MDEYRKTMLDVHKIGNRLKSDREAVLNSGLSERKIAEDLQAIRDRAKVEARLLNNQLKQRADERIQEGKRIADDFRRKAKDASRMLYNQNKATAAFSNMSPDDVLERYPQIVCSLNAEEFQYLYVYEDQVRAILKDKVASLVIEEIIDKHKGPLEQAAIRELENRKGFLDTDGTIRGLIEMNLDRLANGEADSVQDFATLLDELDAGHGKYHQSVGMDDGVSAPEALTVKINFDSEE